MMELLMPTTIRLRAETEKRLNSLVAFSGRTKSFHIREMIESSIDDFEAACRADAILERIRDGEEKVHSLEEVERELALDR
jgi:RHH-type transcriptional regulator, rel operon repressor / antitoxin RelB